MDRANCIASELIELLDEYHFVESIGYVEPKLIGRVEIPQTYKEENSINQDSNCVKSEEERDKLIDDNYSEMKSKEMDIDLDYYPRKALVQPNRFLEHFKRNDYATTLERKKRCSVDSVSTLEGLLDDILDLEVVS